MLEKTVEMNNVEKKHDERMKKHHVVMRKNMKLKNNCVEMDKFVLI